MDPAKLDKILHIVTVLGNPRGDTQSKAPLRREEEQSTHSESAISRHRSGWFYGFAEANKK